jgi:uncharacterized BrkB/YihY/UPF0761 family membrane protein
LASESLAARTEEGVISKSVHSQGSSAASQSWSGSGKKRATVRAAGSLVVLVIWVYYSAQILYFGGEFAHVHSMYNRDQLHDPRNKPKA